LKILTFDIGGANTKKLVLMEGKIRSHIHYFPFWRKKDEFARFLGGIMEEADKIAVTMTAELSDVFNSRREGVEYILEACENVMEHPLYLSIRRRLLYRDEVKDPLELAAANWVASLYYMEKKFGMGILVDVGSTTTDILPFSKGKILTGKNDLERLERGELVYTGFLRTPVPAITDKLPYRGGLLPISSEYFAITADVYNILGMIAEYSCDTPDEKGKGKIDSMRRIARLLCSDLEDIGEDVLKKICRYLHEKQVEIISTSLMNVSRRHELNRVYGCGVGSVLAEEASNRLRLEYVDLSETICAPENLPCYGLAMMLEDLDK